VKIFYYLCYNKQFKKKKSKKGGIKMAVKEDLKQSVIQMEVDQAVDLTQEALNAGLSADEILNESLIPAMDTVGEEYEAGNRYVPEMLLSAKAMKEAMEILRPLLAESGVEPRGKVVIGTVEGDLHDIGENLVGMMLEGAGFEVYNLGVEIPADRFVQEAKDHQANLLGMSALLTTTMIHMQEVIQAIDDEGLRDKVKIMVGGAPVTQDYADKIGADGYVPDAASAVKLAEKLTEKS
jgi:5-methyltetrahydrofolate--homocysteine methyltransferase